jgi:hypothetical protein
MTYRKNGLDSSDRAAQAVLFCIIPFFMLILAAGWSKLITSSIPAEFPSLAWVIATGIAIMAVALARSIAEDRIAIQKTQQADKTWMILFCLLFTISALGTMNTIFYYGEGRLLLSDALDQSRLNLNALRNEAGKMLRNPQIETKQATINRLLTNLTAEITNINGGQNCGVGENARKIIQEIAQELPGFTEISGSGKRVLCVGAEQKFEAIAQKYKDQAVELMRNNTVYIASNFKDKDSFLNALNVRVQEEIKKLDYAKNSISGDGLDTTQGSESYKIAKNALESAENTYLELVQTLKTISGQQIKSNSPISITQIRQLGSIAQVIPTLMSRLDHLSTWLYFFVAIMFDLILIMSFSRVFKGRQRMQRIFDNATGSQENENEPAFLWTSPRI